MAGRGGTHELGYVKRLLRAHSEEGDEEGRLDEEEEKKTVSTIPSREESWVLRKKASFESMWGGGGGQSLSLCLPKQDYYVSKPAKEEKCRDAIQVGEKVIEVESPVETVIKEEQATAPVTTAVASEIEAVTFGGESREEAIGDQRDEKEEEESKDIGVQSLDSTVSQSDSEKKGEAGLNEETGAQEEVPTPALEEAVTFHGEKGGGMVPEGGAVDTVTRKEAIRLAARANARNGPGGWEARPEIEVEVKEEKEEDKKNVTTGRVKAFQVGVKEEQEEEKQELTTGRLETFQRESASLGTTGNAEVVLPTTAGQMASSGTSRPQNGSLVESGGAAGSQHAGKVAGNGDQLAAPTQQATAPQKKNLDCFNFTGKQPAPVMTKIGSRDPLVKKMVYNQYRDMLRKYSNTSTSP